MKAALMPILDVLGKPNTQYIIPIFQRLYSWNKRQCCQLWDDTLATDMKERLFLGTLVYMPEDATPQLTYSRCDLIDGQQRLTTVTLILIALRNHLAECGRSTEAKEIDSKYLHAADGICKLQLSYSDSPTLAYLIDGVSLPKDMQSSKFLVENLDDFSEKMRSQTFDVTNILEALGRVDVIAIKLEADDLPQQVFESLNAKGRPLTTTDLLRNTLLVKYGVDRQESLLEEYWAPIDEAFRKFGAEQDVYIDAALHYWITKCAPSIMAGKRGDLYQAFKRYLAHLDDSSMENMMRSINERCLEFAANPNSSEAKIHIDWVIDKPKRRINQRKIFGD